MGIYSTLNITQSEAHRIFTRCDIYIDANPIRPTVVAMQCDTFKAMLDSAGVRYESFTGGASDDLDKDKKNVIRLTTPSAVTLYYFDALGRLERVE